MTRAKGLEAKRLLGRILVEGGYINPETPATIFSFQLEVPVVDRQQFKIQPEALRLIPHEIACEGVIKTRNGITTPGKVTRNVFSIG